MAHLEGITFKKKANMFSSNSITWMVLWTEWMFVSPLNSYVEALNSKMAVFEDGAFKEVIKVKWGH